MVHISEEWNKLNVLRWLWMKVKMGGTYWAYILKNNLKYWVLKRTRTFIPQHILQTLYGTMIESYFRYCNIVWGQWHNTLLEKLQTLQNKAARTIASLRYEDANHCQIISQYGCLNVEHIIYYDLGVSCIKSWMACHQPSKCQNVLSKMSKTYASIRPDQLQMVIFTFQMLTLQQARGYPCCWC